MSDLPYKRFFRILVRCKELGSAKDAKPIVAQIYQSVSKNAIEHYIACHQAVDQRESSTAKENKEAKLALEAMDAPFRTARAAAMAFMPTLKLPDTLKRQPTFTDKIAAIETLLDIIDDYQGAPWADELLKGDFGTLAPKVIQELSESEAADAQLLEARQARSEAYGPAHDHYIAFKRLVRAQYGASSIEYRRIHVRMGGDNGADEEEAPKAETPAPKKDEG